jgi:hypothetical protein
MQAPNREGVWSRSQQAREKAMVGPRFEQMIMYDQVRIYSLYASQKDKQDRKEEEEEMKHKMEKSKGKMERYKNKSKNNR